MQPTVETLLAQALLELQELKSEVHQLRDQLDSNIWVDGWLPLHQAWEALRFDGVHSQQHLKTLRLRGVFNMAKGDIRNVSSSRQPQWEYNIAKSRAAYKVLLQAY